jgi:hypothetical protein
MQKDPIVVVGQVYLHGDLNEYIVITKTNGDMATFSGNEVRGQCDKTTLIELFDPVDPADLEVDEYGYLSNLINGAALLTGYTGG